MTSLRQALKQYLALRRALGTQLEEPERTLGHFVDFLKREGAEIITPELALRWAMKPKGVQHATWARRLSMVRGFAAWLSTVDPRTEVPAFGLIPARRRRPKPHIYTEQETARLMTEAGCLTESKGPRALTYVTLIGLLSATGLRPAEALALDRRDVDLENGILSIRETKFGKSRFVPVSGSTRAALVDYAKKRDEIWPHPRTEAFFISSRGDRLARICSASHLRQNFMQHRPASVIRETAHWPWSTTSGLSPQLCNTKADRMVPRWSRCGAGTAETRYVSRACRCHSMYQYV